MQIIVLMQLDKMGAEHVVPVLLMNYDGFYTLLMEFLDGAITYGAMILLSIILA
jgi:hypothetical protein